MLDGRKRITNVIAACSVAALSGSLLVAAPSYADRELEQAQAKVDRLFHEAEQASERYNDARVELAELRTRLRTVRNDLARQEEKVEVVRQRVAATVVAQYQGQALSTATQVLLSEDIDAFLERISAVTAYGDQQSQLMVEFATQMKRLELREAAAKRELAEVAEIKERLAREKAEIDKKAGEAQELLERLEDEAAAEAAAATATATRAPRVSRTAERPALTSVPASGRAGAAVSYALAQVGDAYVYGATGESAFDCSGLTMRAWAQAGVSLPHSSSAQMSSGPAVSSSDLQPGDLVFYYSPVSHVGIYIGNGQIVHAANPSTGVQITGVFSMPFSGAVRPS